MEPVKPAAGTHGHQVLCFALAGEDYAIPILRVREILAGTVLTRIPNTPPYMPGVLNLRGTIVPVLDLRQRFNLGPAPDGGRPITVIVEAQERIIGMQVDAVSDVLGLDPDQIKPPPEWGTRNQLGREFVSGLASIRSEASDEMLLILLDLDRLLLAEAFQDLPPPD